MKKILALTIAFCILLTAYDTVAVISNTSNKTQNSTALNDIIYNATKEIDVNFSSDDIPDNGIIQIKDGKMLSDILTMIGESELIKDESKIKNMGGRVSKNNRLILVLQNGAKKEFTFAYSDPAFAIGYLDIDGKKYDPGFTFFRYLKDLTEYNKFDTNLDNKVEKLFEKYNWTVDYKINTMKETIPSNLKHEAGEYPVKIYWAYNNELSKSIGLDYSAYLGKTVDVEIYRLREPLPKYMEPRMDARGIILKSQGEIIGAYIDAGRHNCFACSLDRKSFEDIAKKDWDSWIVDYINYNNELETQLSKMSPEDVIKMYINAINNQDEKTQFACMTRKNICGYLSTNMDNNSLFNKGFKNVYDDGAQNVESAKLIELHENKGIGNDSGTIEYGVTVNFKFKRVITSDSGEQTRFIILKKESEKAGWRIQSVGTA